MKIHENYTAYEGVENLSRFTETTFVNYTKDKLNSCNKHISFIQSIFPQKKLNVLEVGSGSGKLLFRMEQEKMLELGIGFELSASRCAFAKKMSEFLKSEKVVIENDDFLNFDSNRNDFDLIIGIDVVINLIAAIDTNFIDRFFVLALENLSTDGKIILESITLNREIEFISKSENGIYYTWKRFLESDPFKYGLDEMSLDANSNLIWKKYFISRNQNLEETFTNYLCPIPKDMMSLFAKKYFLEVEFYDCWQIDDDTSDQEFIAVFQRSFK